MAAEVEKAASEEPAEETPVDDDPAGLKELAGFAEQVRTSARWLIAAFAAVGALLVPAVQIADVGSLTGWRQVVAIVAVAIASALVVTSVAIIVRFLSPGRTSLAELADREAAKGDEDYVIAYFHRNTSLYQGQAGSLGELQQRYIEARERFSRAQERAIAAEQPDTVAKAQSDLDDLSAAAEKVVTLAGLHGADLTLLELAEAEQAGEPDDEGTRAALAYLRGHPTFLAGASSVSDLRNRLLKAGEELAAATKVAEENEEWARALKADRYRLETIEQPIAQIEAMAEFQDLRLPFQRWRSLVAVATALVAASIAMFAIASSTPKPSKSDLSGRTFEKLDLSGANLEGANLEDATFRNSNLEGTDLDGADLDGTRFEKTFCPSGLHSQVAGVDCPGRHRKVPLRKPSPKKPTGFVPTSEEPGRG